jgi:hypothetical protein
MYPSIPNKKHNLAAAAKVTVFAAQKKVAVLG